jgi:hypothetical protein
MASQDTCGKAAREYSPWMIHTYGTLFDMSNETLFELGW